MNLLRVSIATFVFLHGATARSDEVANSSDVKLLRHSLTASYDHVRLSPAEAMGLLGTSFLTNILPSLQTGIGIYSAIIGRRGGFFTGGIATNYQWSLIHGWEVDIGGFAGAGGGAAAPQGGGLMLRPHLGLQYGHARSSFGVEWSRIHFPNGQIDSSQISLKAAWNFNDHWKIGWTPGKFEKGLEKTDFFGEKKRSLQAVQQWYLPSHSDYRRSNNNTAHNSTPISLIGARWRINISDLLFTEFQSLGAWRGNAEGYAELDGGLGIATKFMGHGQFYALLIAGAAGGGDIDTGGGMLARVTAGYTLPFELVPQIRPFIEAGYIMSMSQKFRSSVIATGLYYDYQVPNSMDRVHHWQPIRLKPLLQKYFLIDTSALPSNISSPIDMLALKIDWQTGAANFLSGFAGGAYGGGAGGYAVGLFGIGQCFNCNGRWAGTLEFNFGAAGGGGLPSGGGLVILPHSSVSYNWNSRWESSLGAGVLLPVYRGAPAWVITLGSALRLSLPRA